MEYEKDSETKEVGEEDDQRSVDLYCLLCLYLNKNICGLL